MISGQTVNQISFLGLLTDYIKNEMIEQQQGRKSWIPVLDDSASLGVMCRFFNRYRIFTAKPNDSDIAQIREMLQQNHPTLSTGHFVTAVEEKRYAAWVGEQVESIKNLLFGNDKLLERAFFSSGHEEYWNKMVATLANEEKDTKYLFIQAYLTMLTGQITEEIALKPAINLRTEEEGGYITVFPPQPAEEFKMIRNPDGTEIKLTSDKIENLKLHMLCTQISEEAKSILLSQRSRPAIAEIPLQVNPPISLNTSPIPSCSETPPSDSETDEEKVKEELLAVPQIFSDTLIQTTQPEEEGGYITVFPPQPAEEFKIIRNPNGTEIKLTSDKIENLKLHILCAQISEEAESILLSQRSQPAVAEIPLQVNPPVSLNTSPILSCSETPPSDSKTDEEKEKVKEEEEKAEELLAVPQTFSDTLIQTTQPEEESRSAFLADQQHQASSPTPMVFDQPSASIVVNVAPQLLSLEDQFQKHIDNQTNIELKNSLQTLFYVTCVLMPIVNTQ